MAATDVQHGAVVAVQGELEPAAERRTVDEAERRLAAVAELAHHAVTELGDRPAPPRAGRSLGAR